MLDGLVMIQSSAFHVITHLRTRKFFEINRQCLSKKFWCHFMFEQLGLIGCGLMGGSFALALKRAGLVKRIVGYSKSPSTTERARQMGVIDVEAPSALLAVSGADIVLLAIPVSATEATFKAIRHLVGPNTLIMDVGSTKRDVVDAARRVLRNDVGSFVPCHPITGKEVSGVEHADADLYVGRQVILTGGASQLTGLTELAARILNRPVRIGRLSERPVVQAGTPEPAGGTPALPAREPDLAEHFAGLQSRRPPRRSPHRPPPRRRILESPRRPQGGGEEVRAACLQQCER